MNCKTIWLWNRQAKTKVQFANNVKELCLDRQYQRTWKLKIVLQLIKVLKYISQNNVSKLIKTRSLKSHTLTFEMVTSSSGSGRFGRDPWKLYRWRPQLTKNLTKTWLTRVTKETFTSMMQQSSSQSAIPNRSSLAMMLSTFNYTRCLHDSSINLCHCHSHQ